MPVFSTLPSELEEAAQIDGASWPRIYYSISLPLIKPALATMALFTFRGSWNNLLGPIIYLNKFRAQELGAIQGLVLVQASLRNSSGVG